MIKNTFCFYTYCSFLVCLNIFSQVEIYKSDIVFEDFQSKELCSSLLVSGNTILFDGGNHKLYIINKGDLKTVRERGISRKSAKSRPINSEYLIRTNKSHTFILTKKQLFVFTKNKQKVLQLDLETAFPTDHFTNDAYAAILETHPGTVWFYYQKYLIHYDFKDRRCLRKVDLMFWNPHQLVVDNRTIWLISKNDGQLYALDFEPNDEIDINIKRKKAMQDRLRCEQPNEEKIRAMKEAQEKFKRKS
ncbi:hypothetical protein ACHRVW_09100 [Flavobacterium collinsii]|uniref:hypothetical protein n=1 Tax=Flavobacterium collinsii TaxID=1114861 RepID=UPI003757B204